MHISAFFKSSWILQLIVGVGLFLCSFFFEYRILQAFIAPGPMALFLAITLETGKVTAIVWHYYLNYLAAHDYPVSVRLISVLFRVGLVVLSLICSQLFLTAHLDRPHLEQVRREALLALDEEAETALGQLDKQYATRRASLQKQYTAQYEQSRKRYAQRVENLEALLLKEMDNVVQGVFKGPRYKTFEQRLAAEKAAWEETVAGLHKHQSDGLAGLDSRFAVARRQAAAKFETARREVRADDFAGDERINDPHIVAFLKVAESLFAWIPQPLQFVFIFSLLLATLTEAGIMLAFATITVSIAPVLRTQHAEALEKAALKTRMDGQARRDTMHHKAAMERVMRAGRRVVEKAGAHARRQQPADAMGEAG